MRNIENYVWNVQNTMLLKYKMNLYLILVCFQDSMFRRSILYKTIPFSLNFAVEC